MLFHCLHKKVVFGRLAHNSADALYGEIFEGKCGARVLGQLPAFQVVYIRLTVKFSVDDDCAHGAGGHSVMVAGGKYHYAVTAH